MLETKPGNVVGLKKGQEQCHKPARGLQQGHALHIYLASSVSPVAACIVSKKDLHVLSYSQNEIDL